MVTLPLTAVAVCLFISAVEPQFTIQTENSRINVTVGGNALFSVRPSAELDSGNWKFGETTIGQWIGATQSIAAAYRTRAELFLPNGSLLLKSVTASDSGDYTVTMIPINGTQATSTITLQVLEPISNVIVSVNNSNPVENIDSILLTCHASGSVQSRIWFKANQAVQDNDRIITSPDNVTLTIISVNRNDSGTYKCNASNDFSSDSGSTILQIFYGPENVFISPSGPVLADRGNGLEFHCSAVSVPAGEYKWYSGSNLLTTGQTYSIVSLSSNHVGNYTCQVNNTITGKDINVTVEVTLKNTPLVIYDEPISGGAIAGIVIGVLALLVLTGLTVWVIKKKPWRAKGGSQQNDIKMASPGNTPSSQTEYASVERKQPYIEKPVPSSNGTSTESTEPRNPDVVYAQPNILQQGAKASNATAVDNKTDYAELKFK